MSSHQWLKFWPSDWQRDPALRSCGLAARGLWIECLCVMHEGIPYGHLVINGKAMTNRQIGSICGVAESSAKRLIVELETAGVFSRTDDGTIFSRRMVRDGERSEEGRRYKLGHHHDADEGGSGGPPKGMNGHHPPDTPPSRGPPMGELRGGLRGGGIPPPYTLEAEAEAEKKDTFLRNDAGASQHARFVLFSEGLAALVVLTGHSDRSCRALLGRWCKAARDDCELVMGAVAACCGAGPPADPVAWITASVAARVTPEGGKFAWLDEFTASGADPNLPEFDLEASNVHGTFRVH